MKNVFRFIIAGIFLAGVIFGVWALFFNPNKKISVNQRLVTINTAQENCKIPEKLEKINNCYVNGVAGKELPQNVKLKLDKIFSNNITVEKNETDPIEYNSYNNYVYYSNKLMDSYNFYSAYSRKIKSVSSKDLNLIKKKSTNFQKSADNLSRILDKLISFIDYGNGEEAKKLTEDEWSAWFANFATYCENANAGYVDLLYSLSDLGIVARNVVIKYAFSNDYLNSTISILNDCVLFQGYETFKSAKNLAQNEIFRKVDLELFCKLKDSYENGEDIFSKAKITEMNFINSYTTMQKSYNAKLLQYFEQTRENKYLIFTNSSDPKVTSFVDCLTEINVINQLMFSAN